MEASVWQTIKLTLLNAFVRGVLLENIATKVDVIYIMLREQKITICFGHLWNCANSRHVLSQIPNTL